MRLDELPRSDKVEDRRGEGPVRSPMVRRAAGVQVDQGPSRRVTRGLIDRQ